MAYQMGWKLSSPEDFQGETGNQAGMTFKMMQEAKAKGAALIQNDQHAEAVSCYTEVIMLGHELEKEYSEVAEQIIAEVPSLSDEAQPAPGVTPRAVRELIHAAFLNLSLCFLKTNEYTHAYNCATRAMQGDKQPLYPWHSKILTEAQVVKALWRRTECLEAQEKHEQALVDLAQVEKLNVDGKHMKLEFVAKKRANLERYVKQAERKAKNSMKKNAGKMLSGLSDNRSSTAEKAKELEQKTKEATLPGILGEAQKLEGKERDVIDEAVNRLMHMQETDPEDFARLRENLETAIAKGEAGELEAKEQAAEQPREGSE